MLFTVPSTGELKKTVLYFGFKNPYKKIRETGKLKSEKTQIYAEKNSTKNAV